MKLETANQFSERSPITQMEARSVRAAFAAGVQCSECRAKAVVKQSGSTTASSMRTWHGSARHAKPCGDAHKPTTRRTEQDRHEHGRSHQRPTRRRQHQLQLLRRLRHHRRSSAGRSERSGRVPNSGTTTSWRGPGSTRPSTDELRGRGGFPAPDCGGLGAKSLRWRVEKVIEWELFIRKLAARLPRKR